jgi:hypothetical protein
MKSRRRIRRGRYLPRSQRHPPAAEARKMTWRGRNGGPGAIAWKRPVGGDAASVRGMLWRGGTAMLPLRRRASRSWAPLSACRCIFLAGMDGLPSLGSCRPVPCAIVAASTLGAMDWHVAACRRARQNDFGSLDTYPQLAKFVLFTFFAGTILRSGLVVWNLNSLRNKTL